MPAITNRYDEAIQGAELFQSRCLRHDGRARLRIRIEEVQLRLLRHILHDATHEREGWKKPSVLFRSHHIRQHTGAYRPAAKFEVVTKERNVQLNMACIVDTNPIRAASSSNLGVGGVDECDECRRLVRRKERFERVGTVDWIGALNCEHGS